MNSLSKSQVLFREEADSIRDGKASLEDGRDEMNLIEFPLSGISNRYLDGRKTVVLSDTVWDRDRRQRVSRELAISGSDRYGLPTARDEDVLLACLQLTSRADFRSRELLFSRYELLKLLGWADEGRNYQRLAVSLRRWKGVTVYSNRAFYDHARKSWVNRDFGIFDNLYLYERETGRSENTLPYSSLVWNEVLFESFQAGYIKRLDWNLYCELRDPVAKRLYRLLDKRFYRQTELIFDLHDLAIRKVRLSDKSNTAQLKRALLRGIEELERRWELQPLPTEQRFQKLSRGQWQVLFRRKPTRRRTARSPSHQTVTPQQIADDLEVELSRRHIGPAMAAELTEQFPTETVRTMIELFDWYNERGHSKGPGFLVDSIRRSENYTWPRGFTPSNAHKPSNASLRADRIVRRRTDTLTETANTPQSPESPNQRAFEAFWNRLTYGEQAAFEEQAVQRADATKRDGYRRLQQIGGPGFEQYRQIVLLDLFTRTRAGAI